MLTERFLSPTIISSSVHQFISSSVHQFISSSWDNNSLSSAKFNYGNNKAISVTVVIELVEMTLNKGGFDRLNHRRF